MSDEFEIEVPSVPDAVQQKIEDASGEKKIRYLRFMAEQTVQHVNFVREQVKEVENFWPFTLLSHISVKQACSAKADRQALTYLKDVEYIQDPKDPRPYEVIFHFRENPFFSNSSLSKKYSLPKGVETAPADGSVTQEMRDFDVGDLECSASTIDWKDNLCEKYPRKKVQDNSEEYDGDQGSFFHYFTEASDPWSLGVIMQQDILPDVFDYFRGIGDNCVDQYDSEDEEDELDEEDGDDDEEIDLEEDPKPKKKQRTQ